MSGVTRDFTVAVFVARGRRVLMLLHRKLRMWLPPGGHIEPGELPDAAAVREVWEETGLEVELVGDRGLDGRAGRQLIRPEGIQVEEIAPGHEHIDLVYFARACDRGTISHLDTAEVQQVRWCSLEELARLEPPRDVVLWAERAILAVSPRPREGGGATPSSPTAS